jgi:hypothetical protein
VTSPQPRQRPGGELSGPAGMRTTPTAAGRAAPSRHRGGWGNDSVGDLEEDGFHASLLIVEPAERQELTEAFDRYIPAGTWILTEDQQGFVTVNYYPTPPATRSSSASST